MKNTLRKITVVCAIFISLACGWDWDTIQMEKQQFPQIHELITGKFFRHSPELYYWRIKHRNDLIKKYPDSLSLYDDLAMAYDKTGESQKAVDIMLKKEKKKPGLYETYANLGLFYMHAGNMQQGVDYVNKALKVNPNAHFGREKYQLYLGKYILQRMMNDTLKLPLMPGKKTGFYDYLLRVEFNNKEYKSAAHFSELSDAIKGVSGMMTFANHRSPLLLEALGDLLLHTNSVRGAGHLASRAYLKASFETEGTTSKAYYEKAKYARELNYYPNDGTIYTEEELAAKGKMHPEKLDTITGSITETPVISMDNLVIALRLEVQSAELWYDSLRKDEIAWIKAGKNPDTEFAAKYYNGGKEPKQKVMEYSKAQDNNSLWLQLQLSRPQNIMNVHGFNKLADSTRKMIDSIYAIEFADEFKVEEETKSGIKNNESDANAQSGTAFWIWSLLLVPVLGGFLYFKMKKRKN